MKSQLLTGNIQHHGLEQSKLNSIIIKNSGVHKLTDEKIIKIPFHKNNQELFNAKDILERFYY